MPGKVSKKDTKCLIFQAKTPMQFPYVNPLNYILVILEMAFLRQILPFSEKNCSLMLELYKTRHVNYTFPGIQSGPFPCCQNRDRSRFGEVNIA